MFKKTELRPLFSQRLAAVTLGLETPFCSEAPIGKQQGSIEVHAADGHIEDMNM